MLVTIVLLFFTVKVQEVFHFSRLVLFTILFCNLVPRTLPGERKGEDPGNEVTCPVGPILAYCWNFLRVDVYPSFFFCFFRNIFCMQIKPVGGLYYPLNTGSGKLRCLKKTTKTTTNLPVCLTSFMQQNSFSNGNIDLRYGCRQHKCVIDATGSLTLYDISKHELTTFQKVTNFQTKALVVK